MRISRVYIGAVQLAVGEVVELDKKQSHYLRQVLRLTTGAALIVFDGQQAIDFNARLVLDGKHTHVSIESSTALNNESPLECEIIQGLARSDHVDWMIQKTTELGVKTISIFNAERSQSPLKASHRDKKLMHWHGVAASACEQSGRAIIPQINFYRDLEQALGAARDAAKYLLDFNGQPLTSALSTARSPLVFLLGPEGGLNASEIALSAADGFAPVSLGQRILRTETAATAALAIFQSKVGDVG